MFKYLFVILFLFGSASQGNCPGRFEIFVQMSNTHTKMPIKGKYLHSPRRWKEKGVMVMVELQERSRTIHRKWHNFVRSSTGQGVAFQSPHHMCLELGTSLDAWICRHLRAACFEWKSLALVLDFHAKTYRRSS